MRKVALKIRDLAMLYLKWAWPLLLADAALEMLAVHSETSWRSCLDSAAFLWVLCAPIAPLTLLLDRERRERALARLCGLREGDERERGVTGEAARSTLLLALSLQVIMLVMSLVSVRLSWDPTVPKGQKHGMLSVGLAFSSSKHLDPFGSTAGRSDYLALGASPETTGREVHLMGGFLLAPSTFPVLVLLVLLQLAGFRAFAMRRYEGNDT